MEFARSAVRVFSRDKIYLASRVTVNGTYVNGERAEPNVEVAIVNGDRIRMGEVELTLRVSQ
jgi:pSer/pThr/pTyr-binding forkhead associated (FHA) protein